MPGEVLVPVAVFTSIVMALTIVVILARRWLEPAGSVTIGLGTDRSVDVPAGERLLFALAAQGIYLPAACGGRGSCGQCKVTVTAGGRPRLATEAAFIDDAEAAAGVRLACQLKVLAPMSVRLAEAALSARRLSAIVESSRSLTPYLKELILRPESPLEFEAGDYLLVEAPPYRLEFSDFDIDARFRARWEESGFFRLRSRSRETEMRAYSIASPPSARDRIALVVRIALPPPAAPAGTPPGRVSSYLFGRRPGDRLGLQGPYGEFHVRDSGSEMLFIGGGAGVAPLRSMILDLIARGTSRRMSFWYGARDVDDLCYVDEFRAIEGRSPNFSYHLALSSPAGGGAGAGAWHTGFIHSVVHELYLRTHPAPQSVEYYLCGPPLMNVATLQMLERLKVPRENVVLDDFGA